MTPYRILIHTPDFPLWDGGISTLACEYARTLTRLGHLVTVITPLQTGQDKNWDKTQEFRIIRLKKQKAFYLQFFLYLYQTIAETKNVKYDLIISMRWNVSGLICDIISHRSGIPHFQWFSGNEIFDRHRENSFWRKKLERSIKSACYNVSISNYTQSILKDTCDFPFKSVVFHMGVDTERYHPAKDREDLKQKLGFSGKKIILTLSRIVKRKNHELVIHALKRLVEHVPDVLYLIAGKGNNQSNLESLVTELQLNDYVKFVGFLSEEEKTTYYQACDVYVMPSTENLQKGDMEGFGLTFLEANACAKPCIGGNSGGCVEAISNGVNGFIVNPDEVDELAGLLKKLFTCEEFYSRISDTSLNYVRSRFTWEDSVKRVIAQFELLKGETSSP